MIDWFEFNLWQNKFCFALLVLYFPFTKFKYRKKDDSGFGLSREWYEQEIEKEKNCKPFRLVQSTLLFFYQRSFSCHFIFCAIRNLSIYWHYAKVGFCVQIYLYKFLIIIHVLSYDQEWQCFLKFLANRVETVIELVFFKRMNKHVQC